MRQMSRRLAGALALVVLGIGALVVSWCGSNPIGAAPDEPSHYVRALGVAEGDWVGAEFTRSQVLAAAPASQRRSLSRAPLLLNQTRAVHIPGRLRPGSAGCTAFRLAAVAAACLNRAVGYWGIGPLAFTYVGDYPPFTYWPAGVAMLTRDSPTQAFVAGRLVFGLIASTLIALGLWLLVTAAENPLPALAGALIAMTPMVLFNIAVINTSALEIAGGFATICAVLHLVYASRYRRAALLVLVVAGTVLVLSRALGPLWLVLILATGLVLRGSWRTLGLARHRVMALAAIAPLAVACAVSIWWQVSYQPTPGGSVSSRVSAFFHGFGQIPSVLKQLAGVFGWLDTQQFQPFYAVIAVLVVTLVALGWRRASRRERIVLAAWVVGGLLLAPLLQAAVAAPGASVQGRWLLPVVIIVPLLSAVLVARRPENGGGTRAWAVGSIVLVAVTQFLAIYANGRHYAVGPRAPLLWFTRSFWLPPLGWAPWLLLAAAGAAAFVAGGVLLASGPEPGVGTTAEPRPAS